MRLGLDIKRDKSTYIGFFKKLFFGMGSIYSGALDFFNFFYAIFLTDIIKLNPMYSGSVFLISKLWDAFMVPFMGQISDRTKSKYGRRRIYFLIGIVPVFVSFFLLWYPPILGTTLTKYLYVLFTSILFRTVFNIVTLPYEAMKAQITRDYNERNILNIFCFGFSILSTFVMITFPMYLTGIIKVQKSVYLYMAIIFGAIFSMVWVIVFFATKNDDKYITTQKAKKMSIKELFEPMKISSFRILAIMYVVVFVSLDIMALLYLYYMKYYMNIEVTIHSAIVIIPIILVILAQAGIIPIMLKLSRIQSKSLAYILSGLIWCGGSYLVFLLSSSSSKIMLGISLTVLGIGISGTVLMLNSMKGDITDVGELYFGERREGVLSGLMLFLRKSATALAQFITLTALGLAGYIKPVETQVDGVLKSIDQPQPDAVLFVIKIFISLIPALLITLGIINALKYPVSCRIHNRLINFLKNKNETGISDDIIRDELETKLIKHSYQAMFELVKRFWRGYYYEYSFKGMENVDSAHTAVFVSNHAGTFGPSIVQLFFPFKFQPWVINYVYFTDVCREHLGKVFYPKALKLRPPWSILLARITAPILTWIMRSAQAIPVYRSAREVIITFNKSVTALNEGYNLVLFPEDSTKEFSEHIHDFYNGFVSIAKKYHSMTGKEVMFYPMFIEKNKHEIEIGIGTKFDSSNEFKYERDRITIYLRDYINKLADESSAERK